MEKLKGMTEYVLAMRNDETKDNIRRFWACERYAKFLSHPLTLSMFIPCSLEGEVLDVPRAGMHGYDHVYKAYQAAKERVMFEGVIVEKDNHYATKRTIISIGQIRIYLRLEFSDGSVDESFMPNSENKTIEDLVPYVLPLTESAKKQINGR